MVSVKWLGHACFEIRNKVTVVTDPHNGRGIGIEPPKSKGDIVLISHEHHDHIDGTPLVTKDDSVVIIGFVGEKTAKGIQIKGVRSYHDPTSGSQRGENSIYVFRLGGISFCFLGDLGEILNRRQLDEIGDVDILLIPVGGTYTLDADEASQVAEKINPRITIPMHYMIPGLLLPIAGVDDFLKGKKRTRRVDSNTFTVTKETLPEENEIMILSP